MSRTKVIISYLPPLLSLEDPALEQFITELVHLLHVAHIRNNNDIIYSTYVEVVTTLVIR